MAEVIDRDEFERLLARAVSGQFSAERKELMQLLGDPPDLANVPIDFWDNGGAQLRGAIVPALEQVYLSQSGVMMQEVGIYVELDLVNQAAADWARQYSALLVREITERTRAGVADSVAAFFEEQLTIGDLGRRIERWYSPVRAEAIAITEVTRAASEAEQQTARQIMQDNPNIKLIPIWNTAKDELVCLICAIRNGKEITDGRYPPAHPRCRCWHTNEVKLMTNA